MAAICPDVGRMRVPLQGGAVDIPLGLSMLAWCGMGGRARKDICGRLGIARFFSCIDDISEVFRGNCASLTSDYSEMEWVIKNYKTKQILKEYSPSKP